MLVQPRDTEILVGTTREYLINHLAPSMRIGVEEYPVSIVDLKKKRVQVMAMCGNAANVVFIRELGVYDSELKRLASFELSMNSYTKEFMERFDNEVTGKIRPSSEHLLTRIDLDNGAREKLL